jgi:regulatory protein
LLQLNVYGDDLENIMSQLVQDDFLNEERFARSYARGKFRIKSWGRLRITNELKMRDISEYCIRKAMSEINSDEYLTTLDNQTTLMMEAFDHLHPAEQFKKVSSRLLRKGFEYEQIRASIQKFKSKL